MSKISARFPNGVTNVTASKCLGYYTSMDPTKNVAYWNDFFDLPDTTNDWTHTTTGSAAVAQADGNGGLITQTNGTADNDNSFLQKKGEAFLIEAGKQSWFKWRGKVSDATQSDLAIGLQVTDTTPLATTQGIWFRKDDGDANIDLIVQKDDSTGKLTSSAIATLADDTYVTLGWFYDGVSEVKAFVNDVLVYTATVDSTYLPTTELCVSIGIQNGEAAAKVLTTDYVFAAKER